MRRRSKQRSASKTGKGKAREGTAQHVHRRRLIEDIALTMYVCLTLGASTYTPTARANVTIALHTTAVLLTTFVLLLGIHLAPKFGKYGVWGWRATFAVSFICLYWVVAWVARPSGSLMIMLAWMMSSIINGVLLGCAQYLEHWFHDYEEYTGDIGALKLAYEGCWQLFTAIIRMTAAAVVAVGIVLGFLAKAQSELLDAEHETDLVVAMFFCLVLPCFGIILWLLRPCFSKCANIMAEVLNKNMLDDQNQSSTS